ncbi:hypothetical protein [Rodentibacter trehalosifermentans]|uniref:hypothetical protein n=1 Tax=Rodentibacter trehalosifermentans TaxID=1908263 RepID=UPI00117A8800|nr:hypothetical protein [Rodentibacter trehalosifermentans]
MFHNILQNCVKMAQILAKLRIPINDWKSTLLKFYCSLLQHLPTEEKFSSMIISQTKSICEYRRKLQHFEIKFNPIFGLFESHRLHQ